MNCKPGDLAVIVKTFRSDTRTNALGKVVQLSNESMTHHEFGLLWRLATPVEIEGYGSFTAVADEILKPIRDPGDDAKDEMLRPLPKEELAW
jgi:hypothetical protein